MKGMFDYGRRDGESAIETADLAKNLPTCSQPCFPAGASPPTTGT
jgi:hypothetical protein